MIPVRSRLIKVTTGILVLGLVLIFFVFHIRHREIEVRSFEQTSNHDSSLHGYFRKRQQRNTAASVVGRYDMVASDRCDEQCQELIQGSRLRRVANVCSQVENSSIQIIDQSFIDSLNHVYILDRYKLLFCYVPKVDCTNWKRTFLTLLGVLGQTEEIPHLQIHFSAIDKLPTLSNLNTNEAVNRLNSYKKVLFVREPISRLLSAYRDKLEKPLNDDSIAFRRHYSSKIKGINLEKIGVTSAEFNISFYDFISYIGNPDNKFDNHGEEHWRPIDELCSPCTLQYDFIGRMETLERDRDYVMKHLFKVDPEQYKHHTATNPTNSSKGSFIDKYVREIPEIKMKMLYERYRVDFDAFGYTSPIS